MATRWKPAVKAKQHSAVASSVIDHWEQEEEQDKEHQQPQPDTDEAGHLGKVSYPHEGGDWPALASRSTVPPPQTNGSTTTTILLGRSKGGSMAASQFPSHVSGPPLSSPSSSSVSSSSSSSSSRFSSSTILLPLSLAIDSTPPQILRRDPKVNGSSARSSSGSADVEGANRRKTLQERERAYEEARRRIFGDPLTVTKECVGDGDGDDGGVGGGGGGALKVDEGKSLSDVNGERKRGSKKTGGGGGS